MAIVLVLFILVMTSSQAVQLSKQRRWEMYLSAIKDKSTAPFYVLIKVKNLNTGVVKDLCTESPFLSGAIFRETKCNVFKADTIAMENKEMYFEFSSDSALWNIGFDNYTIEDLNAFKYRTNFDSITNEIKSGRMTDKGFLENESFKRNTINQLMYVHILLEKGIMVRRGCDTGNWIFFE